MAGPGAVAGETARRLQRRLRPAAPGPTAWATWAIKRHRERESFALVEAMVREGDAVVDVGANWGLYAARLAGLVGRGGQVDAFEPHPAHAGTLRALARRRPQLAVHSVALSDAPGTAQLHVPVVRGRPVTALSTLGPAPPGVEQETVEVPVRTLDEVLETRRAPSFVKCDVEGLELRVLRGGEQTLRRSRPALLVEIEQRHQEGPIEDTFAFLEDLGYAGFFLGQDGLRPLGDFDKQRDQLAHLRADIVEYGMPDGYVADFLFLGPRPG